MISLYRPGTSVVHRMAAGPKLAVIAIVTLVVSLWAQSALAASVTLVGVFGLYALAGFGPAMWVTQLWALKWIAVFLAVVQFVFQGGEAAYVTTVRVVAVILLAALMTLTTRTTDLLDTIQRLLGPLRRFGLDPWRVAFTLSLAIALVPVIADMSRRIREAQQARRVRLGPRSIVPLLVMSLRHADDVADALTARGIA